MTNEERTWKPMGDRPAVGAIRWDAWTGGDVTRQVEKTLGPIQYQARLPWFAQVDSDREVRIAGGKQETMDQEIAFAADAGLDYWAFLLYPEDNSMSASLRFYRDSAKRRRINFCLILHNAFKVSAAKWPRERDRALALLEEPGYQTVCGGRPLVYAFGMHQQGVFPEARFAEFRKAAKQRGLDPYCVYMGWNPEDDFAMAASWGFDAVSHYAACSADAAFTQLVQQVETDYWAAALAAQTPYVPLVTTGWDKHPRRDNPVSWERDHDYHAQTVFPATATPAEIANHLDDACAFVRRHPTLCPANTVILYAWNEHDEGGWLCPTWTPDGKPDASRLHAIAAILRGKDPITRCLQAMKSGGGGGEQERSEETGGTIPITWRPPETFNPEAPGLGLPPLDGVAHTLLYDPLPSRCNLDDGGDGRYESLRHGTYSHHQQIVLFEDKFIVYWTQHSRDENGPGQRLLAKVGTFNAGRTDIAWGGDETLFEIAPAPVPVRRKHFEHDPNLIDETYAHGSLKLINGRLYVIGRLAACHGWTDDIQYHGFPGKPLPPERWSDAPAKDWWVHKKGARFDIWWDLGCHFVQEWRLEAGKLVAASPLYKRSEPVTKVEVAVGRFKNVAPVIEPYASAMPFEQAPERMRDDVLNGTPEKFERMPKYAPGAWKLTADGTNGLAHHTEFRRPDGSWVAIRDNLCNPGHYYAAEKARQADGYPPAVWTNLFGHAMPVAGELPDGRPWIICNNQSRFDMYLTLSEDGRTFDQTWLLLHNTRGNTDGGMHKGGGPQYFQAVTVGGNIWVVYSIGKEQVGVTRIPLAELPAAKRPNGEAIRQMWACGRPDPGKPGAGFPVLEEATHSLVFAGERAAGAYNHHSQLIRHNGVFHAMWSNHPHGEDGPGQRVLYTRSVNGTAWNDAVELFAPPCPVLPSEESGLVLTAFKWVVTAGRLFAVAGCHANIGFCDFDQRQIVPQRDATHPARARHGYSSLAREVGPDGIAGVIFAVTQDTPPEVAFDVLPAAAQAVSGQATALRLALETPLGMPAWDFRGDLGFPKAADGHRLCEPTVYQAADGKYVMLLRDTRYSHRMFASISPNGRNWAPAVPTDIPDSPSLTASVGLDNGSVLLIGNQMAPMFDNPEDVGHYNRDPLMVSLSSDGYRFDRAFALRSGRQAWRVPPQEVIGRGGGGQYPSAIVHEDTLYVLYSMGKEDIWCTSVPLEHLALKGA